MLTDIDPQEWAAEFERQTTMKRPFGRMPENAAGMSFGSKAAWVMAKLAKKVGSR